MGKYKDHEHVIKGDGNGKAKVNCDQTPPCKAAKQTQGWIDKGAKEDRTKGFKRAN